MSEQEIAERIEKALLALKDPDWDEAALSGVDFSNGHVHLQDNDCWQLSSAVLLALANGIDGCIDAMKAMIRDLQEESAAYKQGVLDGIKATMKECQRAKEKEREEAYKELARMSQLLRQTHDED